MFWSFETCPPPPLGGGRIYVPDQGALTADSAPCARSNLIRNKKIPHRHTHTHIYMHTHTHSHTHTHTHTHAQYCTYTHTPWNFVLFSTIDHGRSSPQNLVAALIPWRRIHSFITSRQIYEVSVTFFIFIPAVAPFTKVLYYVLIQYTIESLNSGDLASDSFFTSSSHLKQGLPLSLLYSSLLPRTLVDALLTHAKSLRLISIQSVNHVFSHTNFALDIFSSHFLQAKHSAHILWTLFFHIIELISSFSLSPSYLKFPLHT